MNKEILREALNGPQFEAATTVDGPLLVLAGAGSGKTRVLTYRIAYLIGSCNVSPSNILAITFTNKAAREMRERTERLLAFDVSGMWLSTFHSACGRILRQNAERLGYTRDFVIYDEDDAMSLIKLAQKRLGLEEKQCPAKLIRNRISKCKDRMQTPSDYLKETGTSDYIEYNCARAYSIYQTMLKENNAVDFDDMILLTIKLFRENPDVLEHYQNKFRYILVDEFQDTNKAQNMFVTLLAAKNRNLCVVGDDDQSIYSFRGAVADYILNFQKVYTDAKVVKLEQNYRSTQNILNAANAVISKGYNRLGKTLWTEAEDGDLIVHKTLINQSLEASYIASEIKKGIDEGGSYSDYAILYRINSLSNNIENALMNAGIPYRVYGGLRFFDRKEIKDLVAYLRVFSDPMDEVSLRRAISVPKKGIGDTSIDKAKRIAIRTGEPLMNILLNAGQYPELSRGAGKIQEFADWFMNTMMRKDNMSISEFAKCVLEESGLLAEYKNEDADEGTDRADNLQEFISVAQTFEEEQSELGNDTPLFSDFLEHIALNTENEQGVQEGESAVTLMTVHSAKGLEFTNVFVAGMEEGIFPSGRSLDEPNGLDEERRLCYVAITRAKKKLYITDCSERKLYGKTERAMMSRFTKEIPEELIDSYSPFRTPPRRTYFDDDYYPRDGRTIRTQVEAERSKPKQKTWNFEDPTYLAKFKAGTVGVDNTGYITKCDVGDRVHHKKFGDGTVSKIDGEGKSETVEIQFDNCGMKRLLLMFAKLTKTEEN